MPLPSMNRRSLLALSVLPFATALIVAAPLYRQATAPATTAAVQTPPLFTDAERKAVKDYWSAPGRYKVEPSPDIQDRINVTVPGSTWYWGLNNAVNERKKTDPATADAWTDWMKRKAAYEKAIISGATATASDPGPIPQALKDLLGDPPALYEHVQPKRYTVVFAPEDAPAAYVYEDGIDFGKRPAYYGYYRSTNGVIRAGKRLKDLSGDDRKRMDAVFAKAGKTDLERRVLAAVSSYEGGFEAINTYDTGWVSIGFIQFITAKDGTGSLGQVLLSHKKNDPADFEKTFRRFGIDVAPDGVIAVVDPITGDEKRGADAVHAIIDEKRLTAVFERAGANDAFRVAQVAVARERYWPGEDSVTVTVNCLVEQGGGDTTPKVLFTTAGVAEDAPEVKKVLDTVPDRQKKDPAYRAWVEPRPLTCRVSDIVKSEAGMATLMDRKVNRGNIRQINDVAADLMRSKNLTKIEDLSRYEKDLVAAMKYRGDFLADPTLSQPGN